MENENLIKNVNDLIEKVDAMKKQDKMDLSSDQDLTIAIMNLVSIEEHFFFTGAKLNKPEYYDLLQEVRKMRGDLLRKIIKEYEGEVWCISKHLLAASMRLMEVGTKQHKLGHKEESNDLFQKAFRNILTFGNLLDRNGAAMIVYRQIKDNLEGIVAFKRYFHSVSLTGYDIVDIKAFSTRIMQQDQTPNPPHPPLLKEGV